MFMTARSRLMLPLWCWPLAFLLLPGSRQPVSAETWTINITPAVEPKIYTIPLQTNVQLSAVKAGCPGLAWWVEFKNSTYQGFDLAPDEAVYARAYAYYAYRVEDGASTLSKLFVNNSGSGRNVSEDIVAVSCTDHSFVVVLRYYVERPPDPLSSLLSSEVSVPGTASGRPTASSQVPTAPTSCACALPSVTTCIINNQPITTTAAGAISGSAVLVAACIAAIAIIAPLAYLLCRRRGAYPKVRGDEEPARRDQGTEL